MIHKNSGRLKGTECTTQSVPRSAASKINYFLSPSTPPTEEAVNAMEWRRPQRGPSKGVHFCPQKWKSRPPRPLGDRRGSTLDRGIGEQRASPFSCTVLVAGHSLKNKGDKQLMRWTVERREKSTKQDTLKLIKKRSEMDTK